MTAVMGIVNVTPDSFSDGGRYATVEAAIQHGLELIEAGADWLDIGGESTRPGAEPVNTAAEIGRVVPVIEALSRRCGSVRLSVDTSKSEVAAAALQAGAHAINDVTGLSDPEMVRVAASHGCILMLMHMRGTPRTMQRDTHYDDLVGEVCAGLEALRDKAVAAGVSRAKVWLDPGIGFGKAWLDNPRLIVATPRIKSLGQPVLIGASRKRFIGAITGVAAPDQRVAGSLGAALAAARYGADMVRVHDVAATVQALQVFEACGGMR